MPPATTRAGTAQRAIPTIVLNTYPPVGEKVPGLSAEALAKADGRLRGIRTGSWSEITAPESWELSMNRGSQTRMTNTEIRSNTEIRMTIEPLRTRASFGLLASDFFRHRSWVIGHSTTGSWSPRIRNSERGLSMNDLLRETESGFLSAVTLSFSQLDFDYENFIA